MVNRFGLPQLCTSHITHPAPFISPQSQCSGVEPTRGCLFGLATGMMLQVNDKYLVIQRPTDVLAYPGGWGFPTGYVGQGEELRDAALRKMDEEVGIKSADIWIGLGETPLAVIESIPQSYIHNIYLLYKAEMQHIPTIRPNRQKVADYKWLRLEEMKCQIDNFSKGVQQVIRTLE